jgi:hypothetical protein
MQQGLGRFSTALLALALAAGVSTAHAAGDQSGPQQDTPKDCKNNPNDARCKDSK